jgi:hypothetical protein
MCTQLGDSGMYKVKAKFPDSTSEVLMVGNDLNLNLNTNAPPPPSRVLIDTLMQMKK